MFFQQERRRNAINSQIKRLLTPLMKYMYLFILIVYGVQEVHKEHVNEFFMGTCNSRNIYFSRLLYYNSDYIFHPPNELYSLYSHNINTDAS